MTKAYFIKTPNGSLAPMDVESAKYVERKKVGQGFEVTIKGVRNIKFLRKFFSLMRYAYDHWNPEELGERDFDEFRKDVIKYSGFYRLIVRPDGSVEKVAKSINFAEMDEVEFERVYSACIDTLLRSLLAGQTREDVDQVVNHILAYDS